MDVVLRFAKLYRNVDFDCQDTMGKYFSQTRFVSFHDPSTKLNEHTQKTLIRAYNETSEDFNQPCNSQSVQSVIMAVEHQMLMESRIPLVSSEDTCVVSDRTI